MNELNVCISNEKLVEASVLAMTQSAKVFGKAPAIAAQPARLPGLVPAWRAEYFEGAGSRTRRSIIIVAPNVADALEEVRPRMTLVAAQK
jgi:hypothetical protein